MGEHKPLNQAAIRSKKVCHCVLIVLLLKTLKGLCTAADQHQTAERKRQQLAGEHSGAFSSERDRCFPQELVETKKELKESEYLAYICHMTRNKTSAACVNKPHQLKMSYVNVVLTNCFRCSRSC